MRAVAVTCVLLSGLVLTGCGGGSSDKWKRIGKGVVDVVRKHNQRQRNADIPYLEVEQPKTCQITGTDGADRVYVECD